MDLLDADILQMKQRLDGLYAEKQRVSFFATASELEHAKYFTKTLVNDLRQASEEFDRGDPTDSIVMAKLQERRTILKALLDDFRNAQNMLESVDKEILLLNRQLDAKNRAKTTKKDSFVPEIVMKQQETKR